MKVNFFDGALPAKVKVPAKRYPQFITAFEKLVDEAQARIRAIEDMQRPYNIVVEALDRANLPNDCKVTLGASVVSVRLQAIPANALADFDALIASIGKGLKEAGLHRDGIPSRYDGGSHTSFCRHWNNYQVKGGLYISLSIHASEAGLMDIEFVKSERTSVETVFTAKPRHGVPVATTTLAQDDDDEVLF